MKPERRTWFAYLAFPLFLALLLVLVIVFRGQLVALFRDREAIRAWIAARSGHGRLAFVGLQFLQVLLFVIPGEIVQVAGGYVFGFWEGTLLSVIGITLGSVANFLVGRLLGRPFVESVFRKEKIEDLERVTASGRAAAGFFLLFVIPGIPKDALCYLAGISRLSLPMFFAISMIGRLPGILGSSFMGSATFEGSYRAALVVLAVSSSLFFFGLVFKEKIVALLASRLHRSTKGSADDDGGPGGPDGSSGPGGKRGDSDKRGKRGEAS
ncbi:MAG: TVP38/TMEM64 family protein [Spirochaetaceae bacterium]|nr:TVP38/TMEM64 family protein [Spirochaetaceae bacterium]